jgi:hypothetical protein
MITIVAAEWCFGVINLLVGHDRLYDNFMIMFVKMRRVTV